MTGTQPPIYRFGDFTLDGGKRLLLKANGEPVQLTPKVFDLLFYLVSHAGKMIDKDELMSEIWADTIVEENNLSQNISILRKILGEKRGEHKFIATVPGRGYKFVADVVEDSSELDVQSSRPSEIIDPVSQVSEFVAEEQRPATGSRPHRLIVFAALIVLGSVAIGFYVWRNSNKSLSAASAKTMAVLPFKPILTDNRDEALEMGMADTLIARLSASKNIAVRPLSAVRRFADPQQDALSAGKDLGVDAVLDGNIQRSGDKIRVNVRLTDVSNGSSLWSGTFDEQFTDIFKVQDAIASKVVEALKLSLGSADLPKSTGNVAAYELYLKGRLYAFKLTPEDARKGIEFYRKAIDADPQFALAYAGMADAYRALPINSDVPPGEAFPKATDAAEKAISLAPDLADAHIALGYVASWYDHDWQKAEMEFKKAIEDAPNNPDAHRGYSILLTCLGHHDQAIAEMERARELDPLSLITNALEGQTFLFAGRYDSAIERLNKTFEIDPNFWIAHIQLARVYIQQNKLDDAIAEAEKAKQYSGGNSESFSLAGFAKAKAGRQEQASNDLEILKAMQIKGMVTYYNTAAIYNGLGQSDEAIASLEKAVEARDVRLVLLKVDPKWDNLRSDPRFTALMKRLNFVE